VNKFDASSRATKSSARLDRKARYPYFKVLGVLLVDLGIELAYDNAAVVLRCSQEVLGKLLKLHPFDAFVWTRNPLLKFEVPDRAVAVLIGSAEKIEARSRKGLCKPKQGITAYNKEILLVKR
jgi:hypothetical protein